jgi:DNA polymerase III subunit delta
MSASHRSFAKAIEQRAFDPVYVLHGEDDFRKDTAVRQLIASAVDPSTRDFNLEVRRGGELDAGTLETLLDTPPLMADRRVVILRDAGALKKDARGALDRYVNRPASNAVVVLVFPAGAKPDKALLERATAVPFAPLSGGEVPAWITRYATHQLGVTITPAGAALLQSAIGGGGGRGEGAAADELPLLAIELEKLAAYVQGTKADGGGTAPAMIDDAAVAAVVGVRRGETLGDLLDAVGRRDTRAALGLLPHVLTQPKVTAVWIVMTLATQMLALAWGRARREAGTSLPALSREYFSLLKETGAFPGRAWGEAVSAWVKAVDRWSTTDLDRALAVLLGADLTLKDSRLSSEEHVLSMVILQLCVGAETGATAPGGR